MMRTSPGDMSLTERVDFVLQYEDLLQDEAQEALFCGLLRGASSSRLELCAMLSSRPPVHHYGLLHRLCEDDRYTELLLKVFEEAEKAPNATYCSVEHRPLYVTSYSSLDHRTLLLRIKSYPKGGHCEGPATGPMPLEIALMSGAWRQAMFLIRQYKKIIQEVLTFKGGEGAERATDRLVREEKKKEIISHLESLYHKYKKEQSEEITSEKAKEALGLLAEVLGPELSSAAGSDSRGMMERMYEERRMAGEGDSTLSRSLK
jgi:hypothetical protein